MMAIELKDLDVISIRRNRSRNSSVICECFHTNIKNNSKIGAQKGILV